MQAPWNKILAMFTLCSASTLGACAMDDTSASADPDVISDNTAETTHTTDPVTGEAQYTIVIANGISVTLSVRQWQLDFNGWNDGVDGFCGDDLAVDGGFGNKTNAATVCFQSAHGLQANGDVGRITLGAMCAGLTFVGRVDLRNNTNCMQ